MKRSLILLLILVLSNACKDKAVDPSKRVRPVRLQIAVSGADFQLSWEEFRIVCITSPCPDVADTEAEVYEVQIADSELGPFQKYKTLDADKKSIVIPAAGRGEQLVARIVSIAKGAPPVNSVAVMATKGFLSQSAFYPGFGNATDVIGGDVTSDGRKASYALVTQDATGQYMASTYVAALENERVVSSKLVSSQGGTGRFSPDARQLAYPSQADNGLVIYDIESGNTRTLPVANVTQLRGLDWSPDGKWLAFSTVSDEESRLWKIALSGGPAVPLTPALTLREFNNIRQTDIDWSPDGQVIAVSRTRSDDAAGKQWRVAVSFYSPEGTGEVRYFETQPGWIDTAPSFSPDGKQLAFLSTRTDASTTFYSLWVRDLATGKVRRIELLPDLIPSDDYVPHWQGNERLLFMGTQRGQKGYFTVFL
jgi:hypothetical protein